MLTLRQAPPRQCVVRPAAWQSPATVPRHWLAVVFAGSAVFAIVLTAVTTSQLHRLWGFFAAVAYLLAALAVLAWKSRGPDLALLISTGGALIAPLWLMAVRQLREPEVHVITRSASMMLRDGSPYPAAAVTAATHNPNLFDPYLPVMSLFGLPRALLGMAPVTDPRIWFGVGFAAVFLAALAVAGARDPGRWTLLVASSPVIALSLTVGGTDVPVLAMLCLGLALLWRRPRPVLAGLAFGVVAAAKATAWPALAVAAVLLLARDGRRAAAAFTAAALGAAGVLIGPVAVLAPQSLTENTIAFPLGLASIKSAAVSPLPGHLLAETGRAGHLIAITALALVLVGIAASLWLRPPRTVPAATWRLVIGLTLMFLTAPATRFGYFMYPAGLLAWLAACSLPWGVMGSGAPLPREAAVTPG
jgi:Glycosyltransferase family 87